MKISIALCTYNGGKYLTKQLESLPAQMRLPDEIIIWLTPLIGKTSSLTILAG